jgi:S-adenosylmethionine:tRNA ribosyltransferase-isomerase
MKLADFAYNLPEELIAQTPLRKREQAKLLVIDRKRKRIEHDHFFNVSQYLPQNSTIVFNNSKVIPARLLGKKTRSSGAVEIFLLKALGDGFYETLLRPLSKIKDGDEIIFTGSTLRAEIVDRAKKIVRFNRKNIQPDMARIGHIPLPPYIKRPDNAQDREFYQTVYAKTPGSVASPTAGLHFTNKLLADLKRQGHKTETVTLHISHATFKPVEVENILDHQMHSEIYDMSSRAYKNILNAKNQGSQIVSVGTTSCRVLETVAKNQKLKGETQLFIYPGYQWQLVDILITNFHLPHSTLLMLVYAFGGMDLMKKVYQEAIAHQYRFFSYGDAMIVI